MAVAVWLAIHAALTPVVGQRGSAALYQRSLHLARTEYPWLAPACEDEVEPGDFAGLRSALSQQSAAAAATAHDTTVKTLQDLLANLIGGSLTQRMLQCVWDKP
jgi:hypothetical protein